MAEVKFSESQTERLKAALRRRTLIGYWRAGKIIADNLPKGYGRERTYRDELMCGTGVSKSMLDTALHLANLWSKADVHAAQRAGISLHAAIGLLDFDAVARQLKQAGKLKLQDEAVRIRRRLVSERPEYESGKFEEHVAEQWIAFHKHLDRGLRGKKLRRHGQTVKSLLGHAEERIEAAMKLLDAESAERRDLEAKAASLRRLQEHLAHTFEVAVETLGPPRDSEQKTTKSKRSRRRP